MQDQLGGLWVYLAASPLFALVLTLVVYETASVLYERSRRFPPAHPVLMSIVVIIVLLRALHIPYHQYFEGAQFIHFLLGPAVVALAVPIYASLTLIRRSAMVILAALLAGSVTAVVSGVAIAWMLGAPNELLRSLAAKSVTAPVAMGISEKIGGLPALTAALTILTGLAGAVLAPIIFGRMRDVDWRGAGLAIGTTAHGIGTARALAFNETAGAFASLAMGLNAALTAVYLPVLAVLLPHR